MSRQKPRSLLMIKINLNKAKEITHSSRRIAREKEFEPYDAIIMKQIPGNDVTEAEKSRAEIRDKYAKIQEKAGERTIDQSITELFADVTQQIEEQHLTESIKTQN